jgi:hypothetical protein
MLPACEFQFSNFLLQSSNEYDLRNMPVQECGEAVGNLYADRPAPWLRVAPPFPQWCRFGELVLSNYAEKANDIVTAVYLLMLLWRGDEETPQSVSLPNARS